MKVERRQLRLLAGLAVLGVLVAFAIVRPGGSPQPGGQPSASPQIKPSPTPSPAPSASGSGSLSSGSPNASATPTPLPTAVSLDISGSWSGTWINVTPGTERGTFRMSITQVGPDLEGTVVMDGNACFADGPLQGFVDGSNVELRVPRRDEVEFSGSISGNTMSGTFTMACDNASGTWVLNRS